LFRSKTFGESWKWNDEDIDQNTMDQMIKQREDFDQNQEDLCQKERFQDRMKSAWGQWRNQGPSQDLKPTVVDPTKTQP
jgi:hypothetical protein